MNFYDYTHSVAIGELTGTKDGMSAGDCDIEYTFGQPKSYLKERQIARLLLLRGRIQDGDFREDQREDQTD